MTLTANSISEKATNHRTVKGAHKEACRRLNVGDSEISVTAYGRKRHVRVNFSDTTTSAELSLAFLDA